MLDEFIAYLNAQLRNHSIYVRGAQGQKGTAITEDWIHRKEISPENAQRAIHFWKKQTALGFASTLRAFDGAGLGTFFLINKKLIGHYADADALMQMCRLISFNELRSGDFVFKTDLNGRAFHIGYVADARLNVIEAKGRDYGVIKSPIKGWHAYGRPPYFRDENGRPKSRVLMLKTPHMTGTDVLELQNALRKAGFPTGAMNDSFDSITNRALRSFQANAGSPVDGLAGAETFRKLRLEFIK
jgi:hypothetical protein